MAKQRGKIGNYSRISLQKKFELLRLTKCNNLNLRQTSEKLKINYSTAKTILFQYQKRKIRKEEGFVDQKFNNEIFQREVRLNEKISIYKPISYSDRRRKLIQIEGSLNGKRYIMNHNQAFESFQIINQVQHQQQVNQIIEYQNNSYQIQQNQHKDVSGRNLSQTSDKMTYQQQKGNIDEKTRKNIFSQGNYNYNYNSFNYIQNAYFYQSYLQNINFHSFLNSNFYFLDFFNVQN